MGVLKLRAAMVAALVAGFLAPTGQASASEDGHRWSSVSSPNANAGENYLLDVTCVSESDCWSVGYSKVGIVSSSLIEHWDGTSWEIVASPNPISANYSFLYSVTCVSSTQCWTVGTYNNGSVFQTLIERWDGTSWTIVASPNSSTTRDAILYAVTCVSSSDCWTVGYSTNETYYAQTFVERWNGTRWTIVASPNATTIQANFLYGVTCVATADCWAVGYIYTNSGTTFQTLIEHWDGISWSIVESPNTLPTQSNVLYGVTCVSATDCWAVGSYNNGIAEQTLTQRWDGISWVTVASPSTSTTQTNVFKTVTCISASDCWGVGYYINASSIYQTVIQRWDGTSWTTVTSPNTSPAQGNILAAVTCLSATDCWSVGYYFDSSGFPQTLTLRYTESGVTPPGDRDLLTCIADDGFPDEFADCILQSVQPT